MTVTYKISKNGDMVKKNLDQLPAPVCMWALLYDGPDDDGSDRSRLMSWWVLKPPALILFKLISDLIDPSLNDIDTLYETHYLEIGTYKFYLSELAEGVEL